MLIPTTNLTKSRNLEQYDVMVETSDLLHQEDGEALKLTQEIINFDTLLSKYSECLNQSYKNPITEELHILDEKRSSNLKVLKHICNVYDNSVDTNHKVSANALDYIMLKYGDPMDKLGNSAKTEAINELLNDLSKEENTQIVSNLHITEWLVELEASNTKFSEERTRRDKEDTHITGETKDTRDAIQQQFDHLCEVINALALTLGEEPYKALANGINNAVANAQTITKRRNSSSDSNDDPQ